MYTPSGFIRLTQIRNFKFFENRDPKKKHRQTVFLQNAMRLPRSLSFANMRKASYQRIHSMEQPIYLFPCPLWVNFPCSAIVSLVASRNDGCFLRLDTRVPPVIDPTAMPCLWALIRAKKQSMAATAWVIWLCACVRYWPGHGMVNVCPLLYVCKIEATVSFISTYYQYLF